MKDFYTIYFPIWALKKKDTGIGKWDVLCDRDFEQFNGAFTRAPILMSPIWEKKFKYHVDEFNHAVGGTLTQMDVNGADLISVYFSKKLSDTENIYN